MAEFQLSGVDALVAKLDAVSKEIRFKGGRFGLRKAANLVAAAAREKVSQVDDPETGRSIAKNVAVRFSNRTFKRTGNLLFRVGVLGGAALPKNNEDEGLKGPTPHWRLIETGTEKMRAQPFLRPALSENISACIDTFATETNKSIDRAIKRAAK